MGASSSVQQESFAPIKEHYELKKSEGLSDEDVLAHMKGYIAENFPTLVHLYEPSPCVVAGPSGVGKGTIIERLLAKYPQYFGFSVSHTTRGPRPGEVDGQHYNFVTVEAFEEAVGKGEFIEHAKVHTNYYGTSFAAVEKVRKSGKVCILDIDIQGVQNVKKANLECKYLFIEPPSLEDLEKRLRGRNTETEDKIKIRLQNAAGELEYGKAEGNFDAVITNVNVDQSVDEVLATLKAWYPILNLVE